ncbi:hypothetical protein ED312_11070 [Sinomicrobium pectinilyticum]|uniref:Uncharacterized protein n=1 Tax=Sinomicrobium pectinilyticum TaxID=1084421 RepID=A0A3N0EH24_SINP1|nr:hypothetical protein ED312_11070 [Sinomicrobium pectinilyticum]
MGSKNVRTGKLFKGIAESRGKTAFFGYGCMENSKRGSCIKGKTDEKRQNNVLFSSVLPFVLIGNQSGY